MTSHLLAATERRHAETAQRATEALQALSRAGQPINFSSVARAAACSTDFLYKHAELRTRIEDLRTAPTARGADVVTQTGTAAANDSTSSAVRALSAQIKQMRSRHHEEVARLQAALAAAHGENLRLRRSAKSD